MLEILDSLIATITVVLVLSLIVQAIQQIIKQSWSFKSKYMERELLAMLQQKLIPAAEDKIMNLRPIAIQARKTGDNEKESGVPELIEVLKSKLASIGYNDLSLLETMKKKEVSDLLDVLFKDLDAGIATPPKDVTAELVAKWKKAKAAIDQAKKDVENWHDLTLKAFQDHYERRMKMWSYVLSLVVVVGLNSSLFEVYKEFSGSKALRESAIALGSKLTSLPRDSVIVKEKDGKVDTTVVVVKSSEQIKNDIKKNVADIKTMVDNNSFQMMRWGKPNDDGWPVRGLGWLAMSFLVGLGAPFWYDFLKTVMGIKNSYFKNGSQK